MCRVRGTDVFVSIADDGIGIESDILDRIFDPFVQADRPLSGMSGLVLGLFLSKKLAELHGGSIEVKSGGTGKGSEFTLRLPYNEYKKPALENGAAIAEEESAVEVYEDRTPMKSNTILVVDDNEAAAESLRELLQIGGHVVHTAHDGRSALEIAKKIMPDVVLLDIGLPGMDGYDVARELRNSLGSRVSIIAITGYGQDEDKQKTKKAGFDHHLIKPVRYVLLQSILEKLVRA